jgi:hypothetical protein
MSTTPPPYYRCFVRVSPEGEIEEAQFGPIKRALPGGYIEMPQSTRGIWAELSTHAGRRFYWKDGQARRKQHVVLSADNERKSVGESIYVSVVGAEIARPTYRVNNDTVVQSDGPVFEIAWDNPATVALELLDLPFRANMIHLSWEEPTDV